MPKPECPLVLVLTGKRHRARIEARLHGQAVRLSCSSFQLLLDLVLALANTETGYVNIHPTSICRLRKAIDAILGEGSAARWIETGMSQEYRLTIPREEMAVQIALTPCFFELVDLKVVTEEQAEELRELVRVL